MAGSTNEARALLENAADTQLTRIAALDERKKEIAAQKRDVAKQLKNEQQKRRRLMAKARNLSTEDLLNVVVSRAAIAKSEKAKAKAKASA